MVKMVFLMQFLLGSTDNTVNNETIPPKTIPYTLVQCFSLKISLLNKPRGGKKPFAERKDVAWISFNNKQKDRGDVLFCFGERHVGQLPEAL